MFGLLKSKLRKAGIVLNKAEHAPRAKAIVAGGVLVAAADGVIEAEELDVLRGVINNSETLRPFVPETGDWINQYTNQINASPRSGKQAVMRVLEEIRSDRQAAEDVLNAVLDIADKGGVQPEEQKVLEAIASALGLNLKDYQ